MGIFSVVNLENSGRKQKVTNYLAQILFTLPNNLSLYRMHLML